MAEKLAREFSQLKSLLLNLPHGDVGYYGALLSNFCISCDKAFEDGADPVDLLDRFISSLEHTEGDKRPETRPVLARFVQFIEREVALLDALEESRVLHRFRAGYNSDFEEMLSWVRRERLQEALNAAANDFSLRIVLTAHPTEFYPTVIQRLIRNLARAISEKDEEQIDLLVLQLSKTSFRHRQRISPEQEAERLIGYLSAVFFQAVPAIEMQLRRCLQEAQSGTTQFHPPDHPLVVMGFWPGGDRDGNPYITSQVTLNILESLRQGVLNCYIRACTELNERMTFVGLSGPQERILERLRLSTESRIDAPVKGAYQGPDGFLADLQALRDEVIDRHQSVFVELFEPLFLAVRCFGFHFASMDLRQDSLSHRRLLQLIASHLDIPDADLSAPSPGQISRILKDLDQRKDTIDRQRLLKALHKADDSEEKVLCETALLMTRIGDIHRFNGVAAMHRYIISNTTSEADCLILLALLRLLAGSHAEDIDIVPLFESIEDLKGAVATMEALFTNPVYAAYLKGRQQQTTIMLGFSDGTKDGGYLAGSGRILFVKQELSALGDKYGIRIIFFDGRGGPPGRGGGSVTDYYASMGPLVQSRQIQLTIQGQTVSSSFASIPSAVQTISGYVATGLENRVLKSTRRLRRLSASNRNLLAQMIEDSHCCYRDLVEREDFIPFLIGVTPFRYFSLANHSSRPSKRKGVISLDNIRAISYVASWNQMKLCIPGYYGFGYALERAVERNGLGRLQKLYAQSRFFKALVTDSQDVLARSDERFTHYVGRDKRYQEIYSLLCEETRRCRRMLDNIHPARISPSALIREELQRPAVWLQQYCMRRLSEDDPHRPDQPVESAKFFQDMIVKLMAVIINAGRNSA